MMSRSAQKRERGVGPAGSEDVGQAGRRSGQGLCEGAGAVGVAGRGEFAFRPLLLSYHGLDRQVGDLWAELRDAHRRWNFRSKIAAMRARCWRVRQQRPDDSCEHLGRGGTDRRRSSGTGSTGVDGTCASRDGSIRVPWLSSIPELLHLWARPGRGGLPADLPGTGFRRSRCFGMDPASEPDRRAGNHPAADRLGRVGLPGGLVGDNEGSADGAGSDDHVGRIGPHGRRAAHRGGVLRRHDGRKSHVATTLFDADCQVLATTEQVWIAVDPDIFNRL
jgi:hypothetical protein